MNNSRKILYVKIVMVLIAILFIILFLHIVLSVNKGINERIEIKETATVEKQEIIFDMTLPPSKQKNLKGHVREYMSQVYDYLFHDIKWKNIQDPYPYDYSRLRKKENLKNFYELLKSYQYSPLFYLLFKCEEDTEVFSEMYINYPLNLDDIPVTENYKEKHPKPLFEEFNFIKKENYETKKKYDTNLQTETWLYLTYKYGIGVDEEEKTINVVETKSVTFLYEDDNGEERTRVVFDGKGHEMTEDSIDTREFVFKYTLDEKGYVDDVEFVKEIKLADDKYLDELWKNVKG